MTQNNRLLRPDVVNGNKTSGKIKCLTLKAIPHDFSDRFLQYKNH